jgi:uncharacterized iron-regulated membrane protein
LRGKARDFNWHNSIGVWSAPVLIVLTLTGVVISYPWAGNFVYRITGSPVPQRSGSDGASAQAAAPPAAGAPAEPRRASASPGNGESQPRPQIGPRLPDNLDVLQARAERAMPTWKSIALRLPARPGGPVSVTMTDATHWNGFARSQLTLDAETGDVVRWDPYAASSLGQKARGWMRFAHTGELGGVAGQAAAGAACVGGAFLVWTGLALALRRLVAGRSTTSARERARAA